MPSISYKILTENNAIKNGINSIDEVSTYHRLHENAANFSWSPIHANIFNIKVYGQPVTIPMRGLAVGDGWIDPVVQITGKIRNALVRQYCHKSLPCRFTAYRFASIQSRIFDCYLYYYLIT